MVYLYEDLELGPFCAGGPRVRFGKDIVLVLGDILS
tara:strand:- start:705 stop:812 length:108 start_codon:yes stop_codon:yes gene_type:complete